MSHLFLDSSALVQRSSPERGSTWVQWLTEPTVRHTIIVAAITLAEGAAALAATPRAPHGLSRQELADAGSDVLGHCNGAYQLVAVERCSIERAIGFTHNHRRRGSEAVQRGAA